MAQKIQIRRGVEAQRSLVTPDVGELIFTTDAKQVYVGDGTTAGGISLTAFSTLPAGGSATVVCGAYGESPVTCTFAAALAAMPACSFRGTRTDVTFVLRGGAITTLPGSAVTVVDGAAFATDYGYPAGGSVDGGNLADALMPADLVLDAGTLV